MSGVQKRERGGLVLQLIFVGFVVLAFSPAMLAEWDKNQEIESNYERMQYDLEYYERWYPRRISDPTVEVDTNGSVYETVRIQSIDQGKTWLVVTKSEEVRGYLHKMYPWLDPYEDFQAVR